MPANSITIAVRYSAGSFIASTTDRKPVRVQHFLCPRQAALDLADKLWGKGQHLAFCSEVHQDSLGSNFILTREEVAHAA